MWHLIVNIITRVNGLKMVFRFDIWPFNNDCVGIFFPFYLNEIVRKKLN